jgi:hypothetical protein
LGHALYGALAPLWQALTNTNHTASDLFLTCGMTAVGLSVSLPTCGASAGARSPQASWSPHWWVPAACCLLLTCGLAHLLT